MPAVTATSEGSDRTAADRSRLELMYLTHGSAALRLAFLLTGSRALAEDIAQDAFAKIAGRLAHLRDPAAFDLVPPRFTLAAAAFSHKLRQSGVSTPRNEPDRTRL